MKKINIEKFLDKSTDEILSDLEKMTPKLNWFKFYNFLVGIVKIALILILSVIWFLVLIVTKAYLYNKKHRKARRPIFARYKKP